MERLEPALIQCAEQRLAYPVVDCFFSREASLSLNLQLAILDEALTLATLGLEQTAEPERFLVDRARQVIGYYLEISALHLTRLSPKEPDFSVAALQEWARGVDGLSVRSQEDFQSLLMPLAERRQALHKLVQRDAWHWGAVNAAK
ncbi:hypothetical protein ACM26W_03980 [Halomonas sp. HK25]|uniref:hypothetical protein n=1 Tax=Halomonas sp. HK25 TaxID=3394321 RepID=UPI0039FD9157